MGRIYLCLRQPSQTPVTPPKQSAKSALADSAHLPPRRRRLQSRRRSRWAQLTRTRPTAATAAAATMNARVITAILLVCWLSYATVSSGSGMGFPACRGYILDFSVDHLLTSAEQGFWAEHEQLGGGGGGRGARLTFFATFLPVKTGWQKSLVAENGKMLKWKFQPVWLSCALDYFSNNFCVNCLLLKCV